MANAFQTLRAVQKHLKKITENRVAENLPITYPSLRDAMLLLHEYWQELMTAIKMHRDMNKAVTPAAVSLAAAAVKLVSDLGDSSDADDVDDTALTINRPKEPITQPTKKAKKSRQPRLAKYKHIK